MTKALSRDPSSLDAIDRNAMPLRALALDSVVAAVSAAGRESDKGDGDGAGDVTESRAAILRRGMISCIAAYILLITKGEQRVSAFTTCCSVNLRHTPAPLSLLREGCLGRRSPAPSFFESSSRSNWPRTADMTSADCACTGGLGVSGAACGIPTVLTALADWSQFADEVGVGKCVRKGCCGNERLRACPSLAIANVLSSCVSNPFAFNAVITQYCFSYFIFAALPLVELRLVFVCISYLRLRLCLCLCLRLRMCHYEPLCFGLCCVSVCRVWGVAGK